MSKWVESEEEHIAFASLVGMRRWDDRAKEAVADALRNNTLSYLERISLARLIDGSHPKGLSLKMSGQGNAMTDLESAAAYYRAIKVGSFVERQMLDGVTWEASICDAMEEFDLSEPTAARAYSVFKLLKEDGDEDALSSV